MTRLAELLAESTRLVAEAEARNQAILDARKQQAENYNRKVEQAGGKVVIHGTNYNSPLGPQQTRPRCFADHETL